MQFDYIDPRLALPLAAIFWLTLFAMIFHKKIQIKWHNYFANRRRNRRARNRRRVLLEANAHYYLKLLPPMEEPPEPKLARHAHK